MSSGNTPNQLSSNARKVLAEAERIAIENERDSVEPTHLLVALLSKESGLARLFLRNAGLKETVPNEIRAPKTHRNRKKVCISPELKIILSEAYFIANEFRSPYVGTEHLAYALLREPDQTVRDAFSDASIEEERILDHIEPHLGFENMPNLGKMFSPPETMEMKRSSGKNSSTPYLSQYAIDLGETFSSDGSDFFGREEEIARITHILGRRQKNNPLLIGDPGVGKTAIVTAIAKNIRLGNVPEMLVGKRIFSLDLALVVAGTSFRGEFEARLKEIVREATEHEDIILFIDELHMIVGAGNAQGGLDAANILKPALARGDIRVIGATTLSEYKRHIEKDSALDRRFQSVLIREPSPEETKKLLRKIKRSYETFHSVSIPAKLIDLSVELSERHLHDRFFPDKAIDILDEASSLAKARRGTRPEIRAIAVLENERKNVMNRKESFMEEGRYDEASDMLEEEKRISAEIAGLARLPKKEARINQSVELSEGDLLETVSSITGIPLSRLGHEHPESRLKKIGDSLRSRIVHQDEAAKEIESSLFRAFSGTRDPNRPIGSFLFLGPTGVGKTFAAKTLAEEFFGSPKNLIRLDMSEFMERHNVAQMIGAPAGYVGYGEGGRLTEHVRRSPHSVVLFDEIEKAHKDVSNILLQILDEGTLTDAEGRRVSFRNTVVILTSNIGTEAFARNARIGFGEPQTGNRTETVRNEVLGELKRTLRPELLARIDHTVVMNTLGPDAIERIVKLEIASLKKRLMKKGVSLSVPIPVLRFLAQKSFAPEHGARFAKKTIEEYVEFPVAKAILSKNFEKRRKFRLRLVKDAITCEEV